jgi:cobalt-zinc-cadmium efflux system outer membrane protein
VANRVSNILPKICAAALALALALAVLLVPALAAAQDAREAEDRQGPWRRATPTADEQPPLTMPALESMALRYNPALAAAYAQVEAARGRWLQAGRFPNPVAGYHGTEIGNLGTAGQQGGFVAQKFITAGKRGLDRAMAGTEVQQAEFALAAQQQRVLNDVRIRFYDALVAQRRLELTRNLADIGDELVRVSTTLLDGRQISHNDLLQAEIEAESAQILYDNAANGHIEAWRRLAAVVGVPDLAFTELVGELDEHLPECRWEECYQTLLEQSPELSAAITQVDRDRLAVQRARRERIPNVDVSVSVRHHNVSSDDVANVQVGIPIPIFDANSGNIQRARAELVAAENHVRRIELDLQDRLAVAYRRYADARQQAERYAERILPRAQQSLDVVMGAYRNGQSDYLTVIASQKTYIQANLAYLEAIRNLRESQIVIEGQLLSGSLR